MTRYRLFVGALLAITSLNLCLFLSQRRNRAPPSDNHTPAQHSAPILDLVQRLLLELNDERLFVIEPYLLAQKLGLEKWKDLQWRFDVPSFKTGRDSLTLAMFGHQMVSGIAY